MAMQTCGRHSMLVATQPICSKGIWLSEATENLFSPASSAIAYRVIPTMFLKHQPTWGLYAIVS